MLPFCIAIAAFGLGLSLLILLATKLHWPIANSLHRWAPRLATLAGAALLAAFVLNSVAETSELPEIVSKGLQDAEHSLRSWFDNLRLKW